MYVAQAYSDYSDPKDSIGREPSSPTAHAYSSGQSSSISGSSPAVGSGGVRDQNNYIQSDWNINYNQSGLYVPNKDGGYTRVSQDAMIGGASSSGGENVYSTKLPTHSVFIAQPMSETPSLAGSERGSETQTQQKEERRMSVQERKRDYEDLDVIHGQSQDAVMPTREGNDAVRRSVSDVTHLRRTSKSPGEPVYAYPDKALKRLSSRSSAYMPPEGEDGEEQQPQPDAPSSPPPPPVPPPPPLSPSSPSPPGAAPSRHQSTTEAVERRYKELQEQRARADSVSSNAASTRGYATVGKSPLRLSFGCSFQKLGSSLELPM